MNGSFCEPKRRLYCPRSDISSSMTAGSENTSRMEKLIPLPIFVHFSRCASRRLASYADMIQFGSQRT
jgi:hypothetical protein